MEYFVLPLMLIVVGFFALPAAAKKTVAKTALIVVVCATLFAVFGGPLFGALAEDEPIIRTGFICDVRDDDTYVVMDACGLLWEFTEVEDLDVLDIVSFELISNETASILDDKATAPRYSGLRINIEYAIRMVAKYYSEEQALRLLE